MTDKSEIRWLMAKPEDKLASFHAPLRDDAIDVNNPHIATIGLEITPEMLTRAGTPLPIRSPHSKTCAQASQELADAYEALKLSPTPANAKEVAYLAVHFANTHATECEE